MPTRLSIALAARDMNATDLAKAVNRSTAWICELTKGRRAPGTDLAERIGAVLGLEPDDLFGGETTGLVIEFVRRTTLASGVPERLTDPVAAERVAELLRQGAV